MEIEIVTVANLDGTKTDHVIVKYEENHFGSMPKAVWDALNVDSEGNK